MKTVPEKVVIEILTWLPVISLLRFRCVCKSWFLLIESSDFISRHLHHRHHQHTSFIVKHSPRWDQREQFLFVSSELCVDLIDPPPSFNESHQGYMLTLAMVACCDGIICLHREHSGLDLALWNPATKQFRCLPGSALPILPFDPDTRNCVVHGFGYDVKTKDYKVVRIFVFSDEYYHPIKNLIEVYTLSTDSWRSLDTVLPVDRLTSVRQQGVYCNGGYFWLARNESEDDETLVSMCCSLILTFDMTNEVFGTISLPDVCSINNLFVRIALLGKAIACIDSLFDGEMETYEIWVLNEYGVKESWSKVYMIGPLVPRPLSLLPFSNNGEFLLLNVEYQLVWCNLVTLDMKNIQVSYVSLGAEVVIYKESLVSINGGNGAGNRVTCAVNSSTLDLA